MLQKEKIEGFVQSLYQEDPAQLLTRQYILMEARRIAIDPEIQSYFEQVPYKRSYDKLQLIAHLNEIIEGQTHHHETGAPLRVR